ncbi:hypothetical protein D9M71_573190 [compost metagenome]
MHGAQAVRAILQAIAQWPPGEQAFAPAAAQAFRLEAFLGLGEFEQLHALIAAQHDHGIAQVATVQVDPHGQRHVEKMCFEFPRQPLDPSLGAWHGVGQHGQRGQAGSRRQPTAQRSGDGVIVQHERRLHGIPTLPRQTPGARAGNNGWAS